MKNDKLFVLRAVEIAGRGILNGSGPFGAVITKDNVIISEAINNVVLGNDPTAHAEILAIRKASSAMNTHILNECTLYCSCEPCPMCLGAVYWAGIKRVVYACDRNDAAKAGFSDDMIYREIMLLPQNRKVSFIRLEENAGEEVFRRWAELENKTPY